MSYYENIYKSQRKDFDFRAGKELKIAKLYTDLFRLDNKNSKVLDAGGADGLFLLGLQKIGFRNLEGFDLDEGAVAFARTILPGVNFFQNDVTKYFTPDKKYDLIFILDVLEHLDRKEGAELLKKLKNNLLPGGSAVLRFPNAGTIYNNHTLFDDITHLTYYSYLSIKQVLLMAGYKEDEFEILNDPSVTIKATGFIKKIIYKFCAGLDFLLLGGHAGRYKYQSANLLIRIKPKA